MPFCVYPRGAEWPVRIACVAKCYCNISCMFPLSVAFVQAVLCTLPPSPQDAFLPLGYPDSVSKDYLAYQMWDTMQVGGAKERSLLILV